jgi:hypothetical protein
MGTFIKLVIAGLILNAVVHAGMAYFRFYQFKDEAEQMIRFGGTQPASALQAQLVEKAASLAVPVRPDDIGVAREGMLTFATAAYTDPVEVFPRYMYPLNLSFRVEAFSVVGASAPTRR